MMYWTDTNTGTIHRATRLGKEEDAKSGGDVVRRVTDFATALADVHVPRQVEKRWARTCTVCGLTQHTKHTEEAARRGDIPGTKATEQVPVFTERP